jgi:phage terminase small subunit
MPRKSAAAYAIEGLGVDGRPTRLQPPADWSPQATAVFARLIEASAREHFRLGDLDVLKRYCQAVVDADLADQELARDGYVIDGRLSPWLAVQAAANKAIATFSVRLRLAPQSRSDPKTVARQALPTMPTPWSGHV